MELWFILQPSENLKKIYYFPLMSKSCVYKIFYFCAAQGFKAQGDISQKSKTRVFTLQGID